MFIVGIGEIQALKDSKGAPIPFNKKELLDAIDYIFKTTDAYLISLPEQEHTDAYVKGVAGLGFTPSGVGERHAFNGGNIVWTLTRKQFDSKNCATLRNI